MKFKQNTIVIFNSFAQAALAKVEKAYRDTANVEPELTAGMNGEHGPSSFHYRGLAWDFSVRDIPIEKRRLVYEALCKELPAGYYDILHESRETPNEHYHVEYDPKQRRGL